MVECNSSMSMRGGGMFIYSRLGRRCMFTHCRPNELLQDLTVHPMLCFIFDLASSNFSFDLLKKSAGVSVLLIGFDPITVMFLNKNFLHYFKSISKICC